MNIDYHALQTGASLSTVWKHTCVSQESCKKHGSGQIKHLCGSVWLSSPACDWSKMEVRLPTTSLLHAHYLQRVLHCCTYMNQVGGSPSYTPPCALHTICDEFSVSICAWIKSEVRLRTDLRAPCTLFAMSSPFPYVRELIRRSASAQTSVRPAHYLRWVLRVFICVNFSEVSICTDLRAPCTLFAMSSSFIYLRELFRRSALAPTSVSTAHYLRWVIHFGGPARLGTLYFIILNKGPMKPPRQVESFPTSGAEF